MTVTTPRREATRQRLVEAAIREFAARGIDATSVEQLCEAAGFSRGAFYSNFATRDDLCLAILEQHRDDILGGLTKTFREPDGPVNFEWALREGMPRFFSLIGPTDDFRITMLEIRLRATRSRELRERMASFQHETRPVMEAFLDDIAARVGITFHTSTSDVLNVCEAVFFHESLDGTDPSALLATVVTALCDIR